jgi:hypothetical protein
VVTVRAFAGTSAGDVVVVGNWALSVRKVNACDLQRHQQREPQQRPARNTRHHHRHRAGGRRPECDRRSAG